MAALLLALAACGASTGEPAATNEAASMDGAADPPPPVVLPTASVGPLPGQLPQTWSKPYGDTTCDEWVHEMTDLQRVLAGAEMLVASRQGRGIEALPAPPQMSWFTGAIDQRCTSSGAGPMTIARTAAAVFTDDAGQEPAARQWQ